MRIVIAACLILAVMISSCQSTAVGVGPWVKKIDSEELSRIIINFGLKMKIDKHLELEDSWAAYDDAVTRLCLRFTSQRTLTLYDARLLIVELVEDLLSRLNNNSIISFELARPFSARQLDVKITFESYYGRYIDGLYIGMIWLQAGCVHFYAFDRRDPTMNGIDWDHHRFEPYFKSRELALIKREVDLPYIEHIEHESPLKTNKVSHLPERYVPERYLSLPFR